MLVHMKQESEGAGVDAVKLSGRLVSNFAFGHACHSGILLGSTGVLFTIQENGGFSAVSGEWLVVGDSADFYVQRTITSGTLQTDPGTGFLQLNTSKTYDNIQTAQFQTKTTVVYFEISSNASGSPVIADATMTFASNREDF